MVEKKYMSDNTQLVGEWDWEKNQSQNPSQLTVGSNDKSVVDWKLRTSLGSTDLE